MDERKREYLHNLLHSSLAGSVTSLGGVQKVAVEQWSALQRNADARLVVLTLSGYSFRCLVCLLADSSQATGSMSHDALQELANNLCGSLKRSLGDSCRDLGMSTPNALPVACIAYLQQAEQPALIVRSTVVDGTVLQACLLVLQNEDDWVPMQTNEPEPQALGELELF